MDEKELKKLIEKALKENDPKLLIRLIVEIKEIDKEIKRKIDELKGMVESDAKIAMEAYVS